MKIYLPNQTEREFISIMRQEDIGIAIKNSILFALLILIAHYLIRNMMQGGDVSKDVVVVQKRPGCLKKKTVQFRAEEDVIQPPPTDLYDYVFGEDTGSPPPPPPPPPPKTPPQTTTPTLAKEGGIDGQHSFSVVAQYKNENVLCGGPLFDGTSLHGYDSGEPLNFSCF